MYGVTDLSVIVPTFNTAAMTTRCCRAVLGSRGSLRVEVIVVDDGSSDDTAERLATEVPEVRLIRLGENRGYAVAANRGVAEAGGRIILLLNSDAMLGESALAAFVAAFDQDPRLGVAGAALLNQDGSPQWSGGPTPTLPWMIGVVSGAGHLARFFRRRKPAAVRVEVDWVSGAAMAFRSGVWTTAGPLDETFRFYCQDIEFCVRASEAGWLVHIVPDAKVTHGLGATVAGGSELHYDPEVLWSDLLSWGQRHYGRRWALFARFLLAAVAWGRVAVRRLRLRPSNDATTEALTRAARNLGRNGRA
jgi:GT2 family glycosyltransferase